MFRRVRVGVELAAFSASRRHLAQLPRALRRTSPFLTHPVFNTHHSETQMMRYIRSLERKDVGLDTSMIPLGSCTMKLNAASEMIPVTLAIVLAHPSVRAGGAGGRLPQVFTELEAALCRITGFAAVSLQPNSGAQGEFAGLMAIRAYHRDRGEARAQRRADPGVGARHQPGERVDGGAQGRGRRLRHQRLHRPRRPPREGASSIATRWRR